MSRMVSGNSRRLLVFGAAALVSLLVSLFAVRIADADQMVASWYGPGFEGATTASGEPFNAGDFTAAHKTLPFGTKLNVTLDGRSVVVRVNDRGPFVTGRDLDLSQAAAEQIGLTALGEATVNVVTVDDSTPTGPAAGTSAAAPAPEPAPTPTAAPAAAPEIAAPAAPEAAAADAGGSTVDQYATEDQYTTKDQYATATANQYSAPAPAPPVVAAAPPVPAPERLETPPAELATPGSTVERRIVLVLAAPPAEYKGPAPQEQAAAPVAATAPAPEAVPAPAPEAAPAPAPKAESASAPKVESSSASAPKSDPEQEQVQPLTVLPDTGGLPLVGIAGGILSALLAAALIHRRSARISG